MENLNFNFAMGFLHSQATGNKKTLNKSLRNHSLEALGIKLSSVEAAQYIESYFKIWDSCYRLAGESFERDNKPDFERLIFEKFPTIDKKLKQELVQGAHFAVFR